MDVQEGHPGAVFNWFFDTNQGTDDLAQVLVIIYGANDSVKNLVRDCLNKMDCFNDILGQEILFLFFDPNENPYVLSRDGRLFNDSVGSASEPFLYSGRGAVHPMPAGTVGFGKKHLRYKDGNSNKYSDKISQETARAHTGIAPFFQQAFNLEPGKTGIIFAHRSERAIRFYEITNPENLSFVKLKNMFLAIRLISRHHTGEGDVEKIDQIISGAIEHASIKGVVENVADFLNLIFRKFDFSKNE